MAGTTSSVLSSIPNRRRRVRHRVQTPAYATFTGESKTAMLDLHEVVDISEDGVSIRCPSPLDVNRRLNLCLDLAECSEHIYTTGQVIWSNASGRTGIRFSGLPPISLLRLREWLFLNAMSGLANADEAVLAPPVQDAVPPRPGYTDTLAALTAVQREVEALGSDLAGVLRLIASRAQTLVRASGAAIALSDSAPDFMICRASSGPDAPPVGARLQVGSGFSGECVKSGRLLRCNDTELDARVDRESCRALGIRSILAAPVRMGVRTVGILEVFAPQPNSFGESDSNILQRLADTVLAAVNRAARAENLPLPGAPAPAPFRPSPGSVLFASAPPTDTEKHSAKDDRGDEENSSGGVSLPLSHLVLLICTAITISMALGYHSGHYFAPWIQSRLQQRGHGQLPTVLASSQAPKSGDPSIETATFEQLQKMAAAGDPAAENALGRRYFEGDPENGIRANEREAFHWFSRAAEDGNLAAQSKLGFLYWSGRGTAKDVNQAYFWTVLARARGDQGNKDLAAVLASGMSRSQTIAIEQQADLWLQRHERTTKPTAGR